ncbi:MAG: aspartate aminotransferase family protein [Chloroflexi bacterium]|nr:aspartate aminotransferase family protein [Chloroflexota bacterium]
MKVTVNQEKLVELRQKVFDTYTKKTPTSKRLYERASKSLLGGVAGSGRSFDPYPLYMSHAKGSKTYDVDENEYIDCRMTAGPLILGHCHPAIIEAVTRELGRRGSLLYNPDLVIECAELLQEASPCAERVRFLNSGTEALLSAVRVARGATGKKKIIKFYGHYHGQDDQFLVATSNMTPGPTSDGIPPEHLQNTVLLKYNDIDAVRRKLNEDNDIAGVLFDPQMNMGGIWPASAEYVKELRRLTKERGVVLIFDEVLTGFRIAYGGAQEYYGVTADLAVFAKAIAGGGKLAALAGKEEVMKAIAGGPHAHKGVFQSGTYNDCTEGLAAAIATMKTLKEFNKHGGYRKLDQLSGKLAAGIERAFRENDTPCHINRQGPIFRVWPTDLEPSFETYCTLDQTVSSLFLLSIIPEGVFVSPAIFNFILSFAHTEQDIEKTIDAIRSSLNKYDFRAAWQNKG